jgi:hypothetical protein
MLSCTIKGIAQDMDLETNEVITYLVLRLADDTIIKAIIDEETATAVMTAQQAEKGPPTQPRVPAPKRGAPLPRPEPEDILDNGAGEDVRVFGGEDVTTVGAQDDEEVEALRAGSPTYIDQGPENFESPEELPPPEPEPPLDPLHQRGKTTQIERRQAQKQRALDVRLQAPSRTVPAGPGGYPIVRGGVDVDTAVTPSSVDDDGVGSI